MEHFWSIFFLIGLLVVMAYAWQRFNEPSFPQRETLPRTVDPLRYLFLRSTYGKARWAYVAGLIVLYALFVAPGPMSRPLANYLAMCAPRAPRASRANRFRVHPDLVLAGAASVN